MGGFRRGLRAAALALCTLAGMSAAAAEWQLDAANSSIGFATTKNGVVGEGHQFGQLAGTVDAAGNARLTIELGSVDTGIPVRDQRMRDLLFEVSSFPSAVVETKVPLAELTALAVGAALTAPLDLTLRVHGTETTLAATVRVRRLDAKHVLVTTVKPVVVSADSVGLAAGVEKLREVAGLQAISPAVPVSVVLAFSTH